LQPAGKVSLQDYYSPEKEDYYAQEVEQPYKAAPSKAQYYGYEPKSQKYTPKKSENSAYSRSSAAQKYAEYPQKPKPTQSPSQYDEVASQHSNYSEHSHRSRQSKQSNLSHTHSQPNSTHPQNSSQRLGFSKPQPTEPSQRPAFYHPKQPNELPVHKNSRYY
jgi:hypothetical protein